MHGSLHKPMTDAATETFLRRCDELGLWAWTCCDRVLSPMVAYQCDEDDRACLDGQSRALADAIQAALDTLQLSTDAVRLSTGHWSAWVADRDGAGDGFVLIAPGPGEDNDENDDGGAALGSQARVLRWTIDDLRSIDQNHFAVDDLAEQLGQSYENITMLYSIGQSMSSIQAPKQLAQSICEQLRLTQGYGWAAARFKDDAEDVSGLKDACMVAGQLPCEKRAFREATGQLLREWDDASWRKLLQVGEHRLADLVGSEVILDPVRHDGQVIGVVLSGGKTGPDAEATSGDTQLLDAIAGFLGAFHENAARFTEQKNMFIGSLEAVSAALDAKDRYTFGHSERVAHLGMRLAQAIGLAPDEVERIRISGLVHDVGKIGVPEAVLCKTGRLTDDEFEQIKKHPRIGYNILKGIPKMADVLDGVLYHHERWDGRGYPTRLAGEAIPLYGRILAVADTFDAMSSTRSYRRAMPREKVLAEIVNCSGTQFDPSLTAPFVALDFAEYDALVERHQGASTQPSRAERAA
jgi:HD-GYP domain-containing protein (c-di-GMP phosphodiesterase class II)